MKRLHGSKQRILRQSRNIYARPWKRDSRGKIIIVNRRDWGGKGDRNVFIHRANANLSSLRLAFVAIYLFPGS